jgi:hypothetical protein
VNQTTRPHKQVRFDNNSKLTFVQKPRPKPVFGKEAEAARRKIDKLDSDRKYREERKAAYERTKSRYSEHSFGQYTPLELSAKLYLLSLSTEFLKGF